MSNASAIQGGASLAGSGVLGNNLHAAGASIRVKGLVKCFHRVPVVNDVDLDIRAGEFLALLGPSGSGKSTILMTIAGFEQPDTGEIWIGGQEVTRIPPHRRNIGMVFQKYALFPHMTVWENIAFPLKMRKWQPRKIEDRVSAMLDMVRLADFRARRPDQLSGGQQQRVALARALAFQPSVLLMDEPLSALDKKLREHMQLEIKQLHKTVGTTVVFVTHDQEEAMAMADRIAVLHEGKLKQIGKPEDIYEGPVDSFVADFIGEMNFIDGIVRQAGGELLMELAGGTAIRLADSARASLVGTGEQSIRVAIRPEHVQLDIDPAAGPVDGTALTGVVRDSIYAGYGLGIIVEVAPDLTMKVWMDKRKEHQFAVGDKVRIGWDPQNVRYFSRRS